MIRILLVLAALISAGCATTRGVDEETEPTVTDAVPEPTPAASAPSTEESKQQEGEVPNFRVRPSGGNPAGAAAFRNLTPGIEARHVKGTGAERLLFAFSADGEPLKVYGRKFPVFDNKLVKRKQWSAVVQTAKPIVYLPFTADTFDPGFVKGGKEFLVATAGKALEELRQANVPSKAFAGELLADVIPLQVVTTLAVIEQTYDRDYVQKQELAFEEVPSQYGLKQDEAYLYGPKGFSFGTLSTDSNADGRESVLIDPIVESAGSGSPSTITRCSIDVIVRHELQGRIDPAFDDGIATGVVSREVYLDYIPRES